MADRRLQFDIDAANKTRRAFADLNRSLGRTDRALGTLKRTAGGLAAVGLAAGFVTMTRNALDSADAIAKTADAIGISTDALQEWRYVAELSGVAANQLDSGLEAFSKRLGELRAGTGSLNTMLGRTNAELRDQLRAAQDVDQALDIMVRALADTENQADRTALSAAAFGRTAGVDMVNLVREGTASIERLRGEARQLGLVMDEDLLRNAEKANDQMATLSKVISTQLTTALVRLGPVITRITSGFLALVNYVMPDLDEQIRRTEAEVERLTALFREFGAQSYAGQMAARELADAERELADLYERRAQAQAAGNRALVVEITRGRKAAEVTREQIKAWRDYYDTRREADDERRKADEEEERARDRRTKGMEEESKVMRDLGEIGRGTFKDLIRGTDDWSAALVRALERLAELAFDAAWDELMRQMRNPTGGGGGGGIFDIIFGGGGFPGLGGGGGLGAGDPTGLPIGFSAPSGAGMVYAPRIDARGADAGAVARIEAALDADRRSFRDRTLGVVGAEYRGNPGFIG